MISRPYRFVLSVGLTSLIVLGLGIGFQQSVQIGVSLEKDDHSLSLDLSQFRIVKRPVRRIVQPPKKTQPVARKKTSEQIKGLSDLEKVVTTNRQKVDPEPVAKSEHLDANEPAESMKQQLLASRDQDSIYRNYLAKVYQLIAESQYYPLIERRRRHEGVVSLGFKILRTGQLESVDILVRSAFRRLDQAAVDTIKHVAPFPAFPLTFTDEYLVINMDIVFELK